jgi:HAD superfamily hydrolase (TIGR01509 family)
MAPTRGVLLDLDGTLVQSNDAHARAWRTALAEHGFAVTFDDIRPLIGMGGDKLLPRVAGVEAESAVGKRINARRSEVFLTEHLPTLRPCRGAEALLMKLTDRGFRLAVASSSKEEELTPLLKVCGADRIVDTATSSDDAERSKPDPDILHAALGRIGLPAKEVVLVGDTPYDIEAARKAGMRVVALRCGGWWADADLGAADAVYDDPLALAEQLEESVITRG